MSTLQTKITKIDYDKNTKEIAQKIKDLIEKNPLIFKMILTEYKGISFTDKRGYFNIIKDGSVEETLTKKIISVLDQEYQKDAKDNTVLQIELAILKYALIERTNSFDSYSIERLPENMIYYYMAYLKYKRDLNEHELFITILDQTKERQDTLFNELHQRRGITLYNLLLQEQVFLLLGIVQGIKPLDIFLANNIKDVTALVYSVFTKKILEMAQEENKPVELTKITYQEYDLLCREYLIRIDPSLKWLKTYLSAKEEGNIIYTEAKAAKWETFRKEGKNYINAPLRGNIEDVVSTIHEFSHYISVKNLREDETIPCTLIEFPSLFFEENIYEFLLEKGISLEEIKTLRRQRETWTEENSFAVLPYLNYLKEFIAEGPITKDKIRAYLDRINLSLEESTSIMEQVGTHITTNLEENGDSTELINTECLIRNSFLIRRNDVLLEYPYVIGTHLASIANELVKTDPLIIPDILNYTENLTQISPKVILERLNIKLKSEVEPINEKIPEYQKKKKD